MNPDQSIDRVLSALATTEAPPDMEQRVLNTLQTRTAAHQQAELQGALFALPSIFTPASRRPCINRVISTEAADSLIVRREVERPPNWPLLLLVLREFATRKKTVAERSEGPRVGSSHPYLSNLSVTSVRPWAIAAALIILSLAASLAVHRRHNTTQGNAVLKQYTPSNATYAPQIAAAQKEREPHTFLPSALPPRKSSAPTEDINDLDAMAIIEMNAPSKPAPPLPLSHQELLLAGAAQQADRLELSSLRPEVRAKEMELSKAEFHDFFEPPRAAKDNE